MHFRVLFLVNMLIGWTVIGWVLCLLWAIFGQTTGAYMALNQAFPKPQSRC